MSIKYVEPLSRTNFSGLKYEIEIINENPVVSGLLASVGGIVAVIDENRQIVALNDSFLNMLGIEDSSNVLGLRPGEALNCVHACEGPCGCGTSRYCSSCGAAIAIVAGLMENRTTEKLCALTARRNGSEIDLALLVRAHPIKVEGKKFLLLFIQDVTRLEQRAALERTFFHDINNIIGTLVGASELLLEEQPSVLAESIYRASFRMLKEVAIQRSLFQSEANLYLPSWDDYQVNDIIEELKVFFLNHKAADNKRILFDKFDKFMSVKTDISLLLRILTNMILNALEATEEGGFIRVWTDSDFENFISFNVWNDGEIEEAAALRIFQKNFSTKGQAGRGLGTYSMKLFGEGILGGKVSFSSSQAEGVTFTISLPVSR